MRVISSSRRGVYTVYTVQDGDTIRELDRRSLPDDVFRQWRNEQAARCMRRRRSRTDREEEEQSLRPQQPQEQQSFEPQQQAETCNQEAGTQTEVEFSSNSGQEREARDRLTCGFCCTNEVNRVLFPCGHLVFCNRCLARHIELCRPRCPFCRELITDSIGVIIPK